MLHTRRELPPRRNRVRLSAHTGGFPREPCLPEISFSPPLTWVYEKQDSRFYIATSVENRNQGCSDPVQQLFSIGVSPKRTFSLFYRQTAGKRAAGMGSGRGTGKFPTALSLGIPSGTAAAFSEIGGIAAALAATAFFSGVRACRAGIPSVRRPPFSCGRGFFASLFCGGGIEGTPGALPCLFPAAVLRFPLGRSFCLDVQLRCKLAVAGGVFVRQTAGNRSRKNRIRYSQNRA